MKRWPGWLGRQSLHRRDLAAGMLSLVAGALVGGWVWLDEIEALAQLQAQAQALAAPQGQGSAGQQAAPSDVQTVPSAVLALPMAGHGDSVWPWLQQRMQAHGLQVLSLRPGALESPSGWPTQSFTLEAQGRWQDWQDFERQLHRHVPWWTVSQWQLTPLGQTSDQIRVQWQGRLAWQPATAGGTSPDWPQWAPEARPDGAVPLFATVQVQTPSLPAPVADAGPGAAGDPLATVAPELSPDPLQWPVQALRLYGSWRQAGSTHVVLGQGPFHVVLAPGQRVGREGHRLARIDEDGVVLQPADAAQSPIHLSWSGGRR